LNEERRSEKFSDWRRRKE
jgi:hypothetical protein